MRHRVAHRKLGRRTEHRLALLRNQAEALLRHGHIRTTVPKAKELRPFVERLITVAKRGGADEGADGAQLHARRRVLRQIPNEDVVRKIFDELVPRFAERPGGYTRILRIGFRRGDGAELAQIELIGSEYNPKGETKASALKKSARTGVGGRLRAAAERLRRRKPGESEEAETPEAEEGARKSKTRRGGGREGSKEAGKTPGKS